ncbi:uncharacterized protein BO66DRAFT_48647 [Aspergillus aculeatinus CBS 121060]|uniref:Uncharacterized protein n=1 Tax=Aspergillus aculeatinus CBS 121060 TaxID=1448322 RepID=A0ACD1HD79_9EURO|nr:hypothetical protein BO66DRAFT_48647 [Aspergillus aculeatinus CBS 121060]RAH71782.1 hypothetical protein BO66DRAFT_48647 [Aspergillus aculeatinus CBS 121060]
MSRELWLYKGTGTLPRSARPFGLDLACHVWWRGRVVCILLGLLLYWTVRRSYQTQRPQDQVHLTVNRSPTSSKTLDVACVVTSVSIPWKNSFTIPAFFLTSAILPCCRRY